MGVQLHNYTKYKSTQDGDMLFPLGRVIQLRRGVKEVVEFEYFGNTRKHRRYSREPLNEDHLPRKGFPKEKRDEALMGIRRPCVRRV